MTITYQIERWSDIESELSQIFPEHYEELADKNIVLDPDYNKYRLLDQAHLLKIFTVRNDSELIGYNILVIGPDLHYASTIMAHTDIYYLKPEFRKGRIGLKMFQYSENELKKLGVVKIFTGTKVYKDNSRLFEYLGYKETEVIFTKLL